MTPVPLRITPSFNSPTRTTFSYDAAGNRTQMSGRGSRMESAYDAADRITQRLGFSGSGTPLTGEDYLYDRVGNRTVGIDVDGTLTTWTYDRTYQLIDEYRTGGAGGNHHTTHTYDPAGNRTIESVDGAVTTFNYDAANQLTTSVSSAGTSTYAFDAAGNLVAQFGAGKTVLNQWNDENQRVRALYPTGQITTSVYNANGLRWLKATSAGQKIFIYDEEAYLGETNLAGGTLNVEYTQEPGGFGGIISQRRLSGMTWTPGYYLLDALGSTIRLLDGSGTVNNYYAYDAFGKPIYTFGGGDNPFRWVGALG